MTRRVLLLAALLALLASGSARAEDPRLLGAWKGNRKATEWYLISQLNLTPDVAHTLSKLSGRLTVTYTPTTAIFQGGTFSGTFNYEIVRSEGNELDVQYLGPNGMRSPITTIIFASPKEFWSVPAKTPVRGYREDFRKAD